MDVTTGVGYAAWIALAVWVLRCTTPRRAAPGKAGSGRNELCPVLANCSGRLGIEWA
jgi:hypothetical protein